MINRVLIITNDGLFRKISKIYENYIYFNYENLWEVRKIPESELNDLKAVIIEVNGNIEKLDEICNRYIIPSDLPLVILTVDMCQDLERLKSDSVIIGKEFSQTELKSAVEFAARISRKNAEIRKQNEIIMRMKDELESLKNEVHDRLSIEEELKEAVKEMETAREAAVFANKAKSEFLANMSHEIRTPLNSVIGFTELLVAMVTDPQQKSYVDSILLGGKNLLKLINDVLDLSKIEAGKMVIENEYFDSYKMFEEIKSIFSVKIAEKGLEFRIAIDQEFPGQLFTDEVRLRQILFNIIGNAIKFTQNGYIKIEAEAVFKDVNSNHADLKIVIEDSGIGISNDQQGRIFESFRQNEGQSNRKYGGTGLGLTISKRLLEMMNGQIKLESELEKGSRFEVLLFDIPVKINSEDEYCLDCMNETIGVEIRELVDIEEIEKSDIPDIVLVTLDMELLPVWEEIQKSHPISVILDFGEKIEKLGAENSIDYLERYGKSIVECSNNFEIEKIDEYLDFYPELLNRIKRKVLSIEK